MSICSSAAQGGLNHLGGTIIGIGEQVAVNTESDCRRPVPQSPADGEQVEAGGNQLAGVSMAERMEADARQPQLRHRPRPFLGGGIGTPGGAVFAEGPVGLAEGQGDGDRKTTLITIGQSHVATVTADDGTHHGQAQAHATGFPATGIFNPVEGLENPF